MANVTVYNMEGNEVGTLIFVAVDIFFISSEGFVIGILYATSSIFSFSTITENPYLISTCAISLYLFKFL